MFAVTNVDDIVLLALFFGRAGGDRDAERRIAVGQYVGFGGIVLVSVVAASGLRLLPEEAAAYLGLLPLALGVRAALAAWRERGAGDDEPPAATGLGVVSVAGITFANGGDNVGVYVPVFTTATAAEVGGYVVVFLVLVGVWCAVGLRLARHPVVAAALARWGHVLLPVVLVVLGVVILVEGGAFGL
jgi:cadmium resistance protein CadD (predicted permease)